jgi:integrase
MTETPQTPADATGKSPRANPHRKTLTELGVRRLLPPTTGQVLIWDGGTKGQLGLSVLLSPGGTKTYRSTFYLFGKPISRKLGRVGELGLEEARRLTREDRASAAKGIDPRTPRQEGGPITYAQAVERFIAEYSRPRHRTWDQTQAVLLRCGPLLKRPMNAITKHELRALLRAIVVEGRPAKATVTQAWLRKLWKWAYREDLVAAPVMDAVNIEVEKRPPRDKVFNDAEIRACWQAADKLDSVEGAYIKLTILLAPRRTALAAMRWSHLDADLTLWTTPHELTKSRKSAAKKRLYLTPLPPLARRVLQGLPRHEGEDRVFPHLGVGRTEAGQPIFNASRLRARLIAQGAPADFQLHAWRHTLATYLETEGFSEYERGLVLNHAGSGSVTSQYSHGFPMKLKLELLTKWADHVKHLVMPEDVALLR